MITFLFWNLRGNETATWTARSANLRTHLSRLVSGFDVDVLVLAESGFDPSDLLAALNSGPAVFSFPPSSSGRIHLYTRFPPGTVTDQFIDAANGRLAIRRLLPSPSVDLLLATVHFWDKRHTTTVAQTPKATRVRNDIADCEDDVGHQRTILVGDLNMNPFDPGAAGADALNAVMDRDIARNEERIVDGRPCRFFYNPMWGCFGDRTPGPPGTHYYRTDDGTLWHIYDQVLLRPALMNALTELRIMDTDGQQSLVTDQGRPRSSRASDHLPILFRSTCRREEAIMATTIPELWPEDINVDVLSPIAILKAQEGSLARRTRGMLQAKLSTDQSETQVQHQLDLVAPSLNFYRHRLLSATHAREMLYPVTVTSEAFDPPALDPRLAASAPLKHSIDPSAITRRAATDDEFIRLIERILRSEMVRALLSSLLARINSATEQATNGPAVHGEK